MTDINFYVSKEDGLDKRLAIVLRLVKLALQHSLAIHIHTDNEETSTQVDKLLWGFEKQSFIPHEIIDTVNDGTNNKQVLPVNTITISDTFEPMENCDYLINLSNQRPDFFSRFKKVAEILDNTDAILTAGRERYSFYRERGYTLDYHQL